MMGKNMAMSETRWAVAVTTVPERKHILLPRTLESLKRGGFDSPRLFVDGADWGVAGEYTRKYGLEVSAHSPKLRTYGNWILSLWELYIREPNADRYAIFQDDMICYRGLREYLDTCKYPERGYWNLYLFPVNESLCPREVKHSGLQSTGKEGWYLSNQRGKSALGLVFNREGVQILLQSKHMVMKPTCPTRGWRTVDGAVVTAMREAGWSEWVHYPSLTQHIGEVSSMGNGPHPKAPSFRGEEYDCESLLRHR